jgi:hypothetical protein
VSEEVPEARGCLLWGCHCRAVRFRSTRRQSKSRTAAPACSSARDLCVWMTWDHARTATEQMAHQILYNDLIRPQAFM